MAFDEQIIIEINYETAEAQKNVDKLTESIIDLETENKKLKESNKEIAKGLKEEGADVEKLNKKLVSNSVTIEKNRQQILKTKAARKDNINLLNVDKKSLEALEAVTNKYIKTSKKLDRTTVAGNKKFDELSKKINRNTDVLKNADAAQGRFQKNVGNYPKPVGKAVTSLKNFATGFIGFSAVMGVAIKGIKEFIETNRTFEKTFTNVLTLLDASTKLQFGDILKEGALSIVAEFGLGIEDVNKALFDAISAGIPAGEAIDFLRKNAQLAIGGVTTLGVAVDGVTGILNAYGEAAGGTEKVTSAFFAAQVAGKTTVEELSKGAAQLAPIFSSVDVPVNELFGSLAILTKQIGNTDESTTILKGLMTSIIKPSEEAKKIFDDLGISYGATAIKQEGFINIFKQVTAAASSNQDVLADLIPNVRALTGASAFGEQQFKELDETLLKLNSDYGDGSSLQEAFNLQLETGEFQANKVKGKYQELLITIGGGESVFKKFGSWFKEQTINWLQYLTNMTKGFKMLWNKLFNKDVPEITEESFEKTSKIVESESDKINEIKVKKESEFDKLRQKIDENRKKSELKREREKQEKIQKQEEELRKKAQEKIDIEKQKQDEKDKQDAEKLQAEKEKRAEKALERLNEIRQQDLLNQTETLKQERELLIKFEDEKLGKTLENKELIDKEIELAQEEHRIALEEINLEFDELERERVQEMLDQTLMSLDTILEAAGLFKDERLRLGNELLQGLLSFNKTEFKDNKEKFAAIGSMASKFTGLVLSLNDSQLNDLQAKKEAELALAGDNEAARSAIEKRYAEKEVEFKKRQFNEDKIKAIADTAIATALAVTKALPNIPLSIIVGGLGLAQGIAIGTKKPPSFSSDKVFAKGGEIKSSVVGGNYHSAGGTNIFDEYGNFLANMERDEGLFAIKRDATAHLMAMSNVNERFGGNPLTKRTRFAQEGGDVSPPSINEIVSQLPPIIVRVEDISTGISDRNNVINTNVI